MVNNIAHTPHGATLIAQFGCVCVCLYWISFGFVIDSINNSATGNGHRSAFFAVAFIFPIYKSISQLPTVTNGKLVIGNGLTEKRILLR